MKLSKREQDDLLAIIQVLLGTDASIAIRKRRFSQRTAEKVEELIKILMDCNESMEALIFGLAGGGSAVTKGWLKKILSRLASELKAQRIEFGGIGCRVTATRNWKTDIIYSTYNN